MTDGEILRYFEFAEESERGVAEATPEMSCDAMSVNPGIPSEPEMEYEGSMGRGRTLHRPGYYVSSPNAEMGTDIKILNRMLYFALGEKDHVDTEGDGTPEGEPDTRTNFIYASNNILLPSFTAFMGVDIIEHIVSGCVIDKFELTADKDFLTFKIDMKGQTPSTDTLKAISELNLNDDYPLAFFEVDLHMREYGSATPWGETTKISNDIGKLVFSIENGIKEDKGKRLGTRFPKDLPAGNRKLALKFDYLYLTNAWVEKLWGSADGPQERTGSTEIEMMIEIDAGIYGNAQLEFPRAIVKGSPVESSGREPIIQNVEVDPYQDNITFTGSAGATTVNTDLLATVLLNFTDSTAVFDGPAET